MTTINLKDFYYWYLTDELVEVPDEVAEELMASKRREAAHAERVRYNKACLLYTSPEVQRVWGTPQQAFSRACGL